MSERVVGNDIASSIVVFLLYLVPNELRKERELGEHVLCYQQSFSTSMFPCAIANLS